MLFGVPVRTRVPRILSTGDRNLPKHRFMVGLQAKGPRQLTSLVTVDKHQNTAGLSKLAPGSMRTSAAMLGKSFRTQVTTSKAEFQIHYPAICVATLQLSAQICLHVGWCCCGTPGLSCAGPCELMSVEVQTPLSFSAVSAKLTGKAVQKPSKCAPTKLQAGAQDPPKKRAWALRSALAL